jgi:hypothetical protein
MNAAAALAGLAGSPTPSTESMKGFLQIEKEMFGQNEVSFPMRLMSVLDSHNFDDILCWSADGKAFTINKQEEFESIILPKCFNLLKFSSFLRKLYRWGFSKSKAHATRDNRAYSNTSFTRGDPKSCMDITTCTYTSGTAAAKEEHFRILAASQREERINFEPSLQKSYMLQLPQQRKHEILFKLQNRGVIPQAQAPPALNRMQQNFKSFPTASPVPNRVSATNPALSQAFQKSRRRHEEIMSAAFNNLTMQRARQELARQRRKNALLSLELMRLRKKNNRR